MASLLLIACFAGERAFAQQPGPAQLPGRTISATGRGSATAEADTARMTVVVNSEGSFAQDALASQKQKLKRLVEALRGVGISEGDINMTPAQFTPRFVSPPLLPSPVATAQLNAPAQGNGQPRAPQANRNGFQVASTVTLKSRDLDNLGALVDLVSDNTDNHVPTIAFFVTDPKPLLDEARKKAFDEAERLGALEAERAGLKLGRVRSVRDLPANLQISEILVAGAATGNSNGAQQNFTATLEVQWDAEP
ncbi:MAG: SIMPL domain-containing protein [Hyphomicrobiales bacterium]|nr:SIMPL domain-containing protein [Hyphomicrobiales bacterium]